MQMTPTNRQIQNQVSRIRQPQRRRGVVRFERLLDGAERLLSEQPERDVNLSLVASAAGVPLSSIYHFFPNKDAILAALARRYHAALAEMAQKSLTPPPEDWQEIVQRRQSAGVQFLNAHPSALRLFMGAGVSAEVRTLDLQGNASLSAIRAAEFRHWFDCTSIPDLESRLAVSLGAMDGIWAISWSQHKRITEEFLAESVRASTAYLRCFLPSILPKMNR